MHPFDRALLHDALAGCCAAAASAARPPNTCARPTITTASSVS